MPRQRVRPNCTLTAELSRAARGLLGWTQGLASAKIGISTTTLTAFERKKSIARRGTLALIESVYRNAGITFINDGDKVGVLLERAHIVRTNAR